MGEGLLDFAPLHTQGNNNNNSSSKPVRPRLGQSQSTAGVGVLSALLESTRERGGVHGEFVQLAQRRYTEDWIRRNSWFSDDDEEPYQIHHLEEDSLPEEDEPVSEVEEEEEEGDIPDDDEPFHPLDSPDEEERATKKKKKGHNKRNFSNTKTITQADIDNLLRPPTPPTEDTTREATRTPGYSTDTDTGYIAFETAPQSIAHSAITRITRRNMDNSTLQVPRVAGSDNREEVKRPGSVASSHNTNAGTVTPTGSYLTAQKIPTRPSSRTAVKWNGKTVVISIPIDERDAAGVGAYSRPNPLTKQQWAERRQKWIDEGYNVEERYSDPGQTRTVYPSDYSEKSEREEIIVKVPNRSGKCLLKEMMGLG